MVLKYIFGMFLKCTWNMPKFRSEMWEDTATSPQTHPFHHRCMGTKRSEELQRFTRLVQSNLSNKTSKYNHIINTRKELH